MSLVAYPSHFPKYIWHVVGMYAATRMQAPLFCTSVQVTDNFCHQNETGDIINSHHSNGNLSIHRITFLNASIFHSESYQGDQVEVKTKEYN